MAENFEDYSIEVLKEMQRESGVSNSKRLISILMKKLAFVEERVASLESGSPKEINTGDESKFWDGKPASSGIVPFPISGISDKHAKELFDDFGQSIKIRIEELAKSNSEGRDCISCNQVLIRKDSVLIDYYENLLEAIDVEEFGNMQKRYLTKEEEANYRSFLKFFHPTYYFEQKMNLACLIGLKDSESLRILDIGCGAGHFLSIAEFFGHEAIGLDLTYEELKKGDLTHPYGTICDIFGVKREHGRIQPTGEIPEIESGPFDLVTAFLPVFNIYRNRDPWSEETWDLFFKGVSENWITDGGRVFFQFTTGKMDEKSWSYFKKKSVWMDQKSGQALVRL